MRRRNVLNILATVVLGAGTLSVAAEKEQKVTLTITGMTWAACVDTVQGALEAVEGVKEATVSLQNNEAVVTCDPEVVEVEDLIKAVKEAQGMNAYDAALKEQK